MTIRFEAFTENASRLSREDPSSNIGDIFMDLLLKWDEDLYYSTFATALDPSFYPKNLSGFLLNVKRNLPEYISACSHMDAEKPTSCYMCKGKE